MSAITGMWNEILGLVTTTDIAMLIVAGLIIVGTGLLMQSGAALGTATLAALVIFALANYAQGVVMGANASAAAEIGWQKLLDMQAGMLIAYFILFGVLISIAFAVRSVIFNR